MSYVRVAGALAAAALLMLLVNAQAQSLPPEGAACDVYFNPSPARQSNADRRRQATSMCSMSATDYPQTSCTRVETLIAFPLIPPHRLRVPARHLLDRRA